MKLKDLTEDDAEEFLKKIDEDRKESEDRWREFKRNQDTMSNEDKIEFVRQELIACRARLVTLTKSLIDFENNPDIDIEEFMEEVQLETGAQGSTPEVLSNVCKRFGLAWSDDAGQFVKVKNGQSGRTNH